MQNPQDAQVRAVCLDAALRTPGIANADDVVAAAKKFIEFVNEQPVKPQLVPASTPILTSVKEPLNG